MTMAETLVSSKVSIVLWADARISTDGSILELPEMQTIGVIIEKNKTVMRICSMFGDDGEPLVITSLPTVLVRNIRKL